MPPYDMETGVYSTFSKEEIMVTYRDKVIGVLNKETIDFGGEHGEDTDK